MKSKILAVLLFSFTVVAVAFYPTYQSLGQSQGARPPTGVNHPIIPPAVIPKVVQPKIEVVFALDTTGSMSGLIQAAKEKIWSIASTLAQTQPAPEIKIGLVAYRDRGDDYVTKVVDLSSDLDRVYATLMDFSAEGGGDGPESVNKALFDAVNKISWNSDPKAYKVIFLVGDAPPHMDYLNDVKYPQSVALAQKKGIVVNAIQCGGEQETTQKWRQIAQFGQGQFFQVSQDGNAVAINTPYDTKLAELSTKLDQTRLYYGNTAEKADMERKKDASTKMYAEASTASQARRAKFNTSASGKTNLLGSKELVEDVANGSMDLSKIDTAHLPAPLQAMSPPAQKQFVADLAKQRETLTREIQTLAEQRDTFIKKKVTEQGGAKDSLDAKIYSALRDQAEKKGFSYKAEALDY